MAHARTFQPLDPDALTRLRAAVAESSKVQIARKLHIGRNTLYRALRGAGVLPAVSAAIVSGLAA